MSAGDARRRTGGNLYDAHLVRALRERGIGVRVIGADRVDARLVLAALRPDVVIVDSIAFAQAPRVLRGSRSRVIALVHMRLRRGARRMFARADRVVAVSAPLAREVRGLGARRVSVVAPGSDGVPRVPRVPRRRGGDRLRLVCVANWSRAKGIDVLARAMARGSGVRLTLVGDEGAGVYTERVRSLLPRGVVVRRGPRGASGVARAYAGADTVVVPSRSEGYGIAASEAIALGIPVIASDLPALRALVHDAGVLVPAASVRALARAIARAHDPLIRARWTRAARRRARLLPRWRETERALLGIVEEELHVQTAGGGSMPPRGVTSPKRKRQYEKIKKSELSRGRSPKTAKRIAAATTNKTRRRKGETTAGRRRTGR